jgi:hypothetical protein
LWFLGFASKAIFDWWKDKGHEFREEYLIKTELEKIKHLFDSQLKTKNKLPIRLELIYGADYVRDNHLFGEYMTHVRHWYEVAESYNSSVENYKNLTNYSTLEATKSEAWTLCLLDIDVKRSFLRKNAGIMFQTPWLKKVPNYDSDLSKIKFLRYLLGRDAFEEPEKIDWWKIWKIASKEKIRQGASGSSGSEAGICDNRNNM